MVDQKKILSEYHRTQSIKTTASNMGVSEQVVRKWLITHGVYSTPTSDKIKDLAALGFSQKQIAEHMDISVSAVCANFPYTRGSYLSETKSKNAMAIRRYRQRKQNKEI